MRAYAMKKIGEVGWIEKERPSCAGSNEKISSSSLTA